MYSTHGTLTSDGNVVDDDKQRENFNGILCKNPESTKTTKIFKIMQKRVHRYCGGKVSSKKGSLISNNCASLQETTFSGVC